MLAGSLDGKSSAQMRMFRCLKLQVQHPAAGPCNHVIGPQHLGFIDAPGLAGDHHLIVQVVENRLEIVESGNAGAIIIELCSDPAFDIACCAASFSRDFG